MFRPLKRWRSLSRDLRFVILLLSLTIVLMVLTLAFLPPLVRGGLPVCQP